MKGLIACKAIANDIHRSIGICNIYHQQTNVEKQARVHKVDKQILRSAHTRRIFVGNSHREYTNIQFTQRELIPATDPQLLCPPNVPLMCVSCETDFLTTIAVLTSEYTCTHK